MRTATLRGGSRDGQRVEVENWLRIYSIPKLISISESKDLMIDDVMMWRAPDEFYEYWSDGDFYYRNTVDYKPTTGKPSEL